MKFRAKHYLNRIIISNSTSFYLKWYYFVNKLLVDDTKNVFEGKELLLHYYYIKYMCQKFG